MTIKLSQDRAKDLTVLKCVGEANLAETIEVLSSFFKAPTKRCLWDLSGLDGKRWSYEEIENISRYSAIHGISHAEGKTAFAAPSDVDFGISRMYEICAQVHQVPWQVRAFRSRKEALKRLEVS